MISEEQRATAEQILDGIRVFHLIESEELDDLGQPRLVPGAEITFYAEKLARVMDPDEYETTATFQDDGPRLVGLRLHNALGDDALTELYLMARNGEWPGE